MGQNIQLAFDTYNRMDYFHRSEQHKDLWIGLHRNGTSDTDYYWTDGSVFNYGSMPNGTFTQHFDAWEYSEPDRHNSTHSGNSFNCTR